MLPFSIFFLVAGATAILDNDFLNFITHRYGATVAQQMNRADLGPHGDGSFGGGHYATNRRPVVMIHGLRNKAGYLWRQRKALQEQGWRGEHVLATSWGHGDQGIFEAMKETMKCQYVKQVRYFLLSVIHYYQSDIDVMAYSMGSPITRKAILGGRCVDTNEYIGESISHHINVFLSVAGANHGSALCNMPFPGVCGQVAGLNCMSKFLKDINSRTGYEGKHRYYIASTMDEAIGLFNGCGQKSSQFSGAGEIMVQGSSHEDVMFKKIQVQVDVLKKHV